LGSLQYFVESPSSGADSQHAAHRFDLISQIDIAKKELHYYASGNWDAHPGNIVVDVNGGLAGIDNEGVTWPTFYRFGEIPWFAMIQKGSANTKYIDFPLTQGFPFDEAKVFPNPTLENFLSVIKNKDDYDLTVIEGKLNWYKPSPKDPGAKPSQVGIIDWEGILWVQLNFPPYYYPHKPMLFPKDLIRRYSEIQLADLKRELQVAFEPFGGEGIFSDAHLIRMLARIKELVKVATERGLTP
jgi:hypothetical protein